MVPSRSTINCEDTFNPLTLLISGLQLGSVGFLNASKDFSKVGITVQCKTIILGVISGVSASRPYRCSKYSSVKRSRAVSKIMGLSTMLSVDLQDESSATTTTKSNRVFIFQQYVGYLLVRRI